MSLVADYSASSSSCEESDGEMETQKNSKEIKKSTLPSAAELLKDSNNAVGEVLQNPFQQAERAKTALLEKHVKMVDKDEHLKMKNGKKICWNYRKGRCRFGSSCQYAHDSDLTNVDSNKLMTNDKNISTNSNFPLRSVPSTLHETKQNNKRKRPGLSDSIVPGKRVMKAFNQQKQ